MPKRSAMGDRVPFLVAWLLFTCWTPALATSVGRGAVERRIDPPDDWKPIDYGHPMRDDPTLVYVPPVLDPVHYGIMTAEPLWPIRPSKLPPFVLHAPLRPVDARAAVNQQRRYAVQRQQEAERRLERHWHHQAHNHRRPAPEQSRRHDVAAPLYPRVPVVPLHGWTDRERPRDRAQQRPPGRPAPDRSHGGAIDRHDDAGDADHVADKKRAESAKKPRKPSRPFEFVIQQGHSKVRKYGSTTP